MSKTTCAVVLSLLALSCGGNSQRNNTPTNPQAPLTVVVVLDAFSQGAVLAASVSFDGQEIGSSDWSSFGGCVTGCLLQGTGATLPPKGTHKVTVTILRQVGDVVSYNVRGTVFLNATGTIPLPLQTPDLKAGGSVDYGVDI